MAVEDQAGAMDGWNEGGMDVQACALKPLHAPHLSCPETHAVIVVIRQRPLRGLNGSCVIPVSNLLLFMLQSDKWLAHLQSPPQ